MAIKLLATKLPKGKKSDSMTFEKSWHFVSMNSPQIYIYIEHNNEYINIYVYIHDIKLYICTVF